MGKCISFFFMKKKLLPINFAIRENIYRRAFIIIDERLWMSIFSYMIIEC